DWDVVCLNSVYVYVLWVARGGRKAWRPAVETGFAIKLRDSVPADKLLGATAGGRRAGYRKRRPVRRVASPPGPAAGGRKLDPTHHSLGLKKKPVRSPRGRDEPPAPLPRRATARSGPPA